MVLVRDLSPYDLYAMVENFLVAETAIDPDKPWSMVYNHLTFAIDIWQPQPNDVLGWLRFAQVLEDRRGPTIYAGGRREGRSSLRADDLRGRSTFLPLTPQPHMDRWRPEDAVREAEACQARLLAAFAEYEELKRQMGNSPAGSLAPAFFRPERPPGTV